MKTSELIERFLDYGIYNFLGLIVLVGFAIEFLWLIGRGLVRWLRRH